MDHILILAAITLVILVLRRIWQRWRKLQHRSRRRKGNNYLYQDYNYDYDTDYLAIDRAWDRIQEEQPIPDDLDLDEAKTHSEGFIIDSKQDSSLDDVTLNEAIEGYLSLDLDLEESDDDEQKNNILASTESIKNKTVASNTGNLQNH